MCLTKSVKFHFSRQFHICDQIFPFSHVKSLEKLIFKTFTLYVFRLFRIQLISNKIIWISGLYKYIYINLSLRVIQRDNVLGLLPILWRARPAGHSGVYTETCPRGLTLWGWGLETLYFSEPGRLSPPAPSPLSFKRSVQFW